MDPFFALIRFVLVLWGVIYFITESWLLTYFRIFVAKGSLARAMFIYCKSCVGAWVGLCLTALGLYPFGQHAFVEALFASIALGKIWSLFGSDTFDSERVFLGIPELIGEEHDETSEGENG